MGVTHAGPVEMLSTPVMIGMFEGVCLHMMQERLPQGQTSVGARVDVRHLAPSPVGKPVRIKATFLRTEGRRLIFEVQAFSGDTKIGEGIHERAVIDPSRFQARS
jgi:predicted thioesterase